jgi:hypothetical protein
MAEHRHDAPTGPARSYDTELDVRAIAGFTVGVIIITVFAAAIMWWMSIYYKHEEEAKDRAPSPLPEARVDAIPPGPRLQPSPPRDMDELRMRDRQALTTYGWVDQAHGLAHIPVDRAIDILAEKGAKK